MRLTRGLHNLRAGDRGCVATIGTYDGIHLGHQFVLARVRKKAADMQCASVMMTFEPTAAEYFDAGSAPPRLTRLSEKFRALKTQQLDAMMVIRFNRRLAVLEAHDFIKEYLVDGLGIRSLIIGDDFRFGRGRQGDLSTLRLAGRDHGFDVEQAASFELNGVRISSTTVRDALARGDMTTAAQYLGRAYRMSGRVIEGRRLGRDLGYATANIVPRRIKSPVNGIFAVRVSGIPGAPFDGVASIGTRPTVAGREPLLEVHLFDFSGDLYGRHLDVDFIARIRDEVKFPDIAALTQQMDKDSDLARTLLSQYARENQED